MLAYEGDERLVRWTFGVLNEKPSKAGGFLSRFAIAVGSADVENYAILRPALVKLAEKYPQYDDPAAVEGG